MSPRLCFIGFGEAGQAIAAGLRPCVAAISAWDILFPVAGGARLREAADRIGVRIAASAVDAVQDADIVLSAVTAASSLKAAQAAKPGLRHNPFFLDVNSVSPGRKQATEKHLDSAVRYVDVAIMAPIHPARHQTPLLLAGPHAEAVAPNLAGLGMRATIAGAEIGAAAAIKMVRSVMIKGLEALTLECFLAAARAGVEDQILASLAKSFPTLDWPAMVEYNLERMARHGLRRAAEMEEAADTLRELGVDPHMVMATVQRQRQMGEIGRLGTVLDALAQGRTAMLGAISTAVADRGR